MKRSAIAAAQEGSVLARCRALDLSTSSYYYQPKGESALNLELMRLMDEEFTAHCFHGVLGMRDFLRLEKGYWVNEKRVRRLMRIMGLEAVAPKPNLSKPAKGQDGACNRHPAEYISDFLLANMDLCISIEYISEGEEHQGLGKRVVQSVEQCTE